MTEAAEYRNALALQSMLFEYRLESVLGAGTFGTTYLGWDTHLEKHVAIKEYLPAELAVRALDGSVVPVTSGHTNDYQWGLDRFLLEARTLAKFSHPHIVRVIRYFEANGTGYMVMDYEKGEPLNERLKREPFPAEVQLKAILAPLLEGLSAVHATGFLHRDIKPGNIFLREGGSPVLIDFGSARQAVGGATRSLTAVITPGYAPFEQYSSEARQGPWTDIYAMSGVLYRALTNTNPPDAVSRMRGDSVAQGLAAVRDRYSEPFLQAVEWALALDEKKRPQDIGEWKRALSGAQPAPVVAPAPAAAVAAPSGATDAATVRFGGHEPPAEEQTRYLPRARPAQQKTQPQRRWAGIGIAALVIVTAAAAASWYKQRLAQEIMPLPVAQNSTPEPAAQGPGPAAIRAEPAVVPAPSPRPQAKERPRTKPPAEPPRSQAGEQPRSRPAVAEPRPDRPRAPVSDAVALPPIAMAERDRPPRERGPRPGDRPDAEQIRKTAAQEFRAADSDGDDYLSRAEVSGRFPLIEREFSRVDADGDGKISQQEFLRLRRRQAETMQGRQQ